MNNNNNDLEILENIALSILKDTKNLIPEVSQLVDEYFWYLV